MTLTPNATEKSVTITAALQVVNTLGGAETEKAPSVAAVNAMAGNKVDKVSGKGLSTNDYTTAEKTKLAGLESSHFKGEYTSVTALNAVAGAAGDYAYVDAGSGQDVTAYVWDTSNSKWVEQKGVTTAETSATVKSKYEANADTNAFTDALLTKLNGIAAGAQVNAVASVAGKTGAVTLAKGDVGLGSVDNTADSAKSVASAAKLTTARTINGVSFDGTAAITHYGTCATAAATAAKTVALTSFALVTGAEVTVMFTVTNTAASPTLDVNGTGAKAIYYRNAAISAGYLAANRVYKFVYDGTQYELIGDLDTNTTYAAATTSANGLMSAADKTKLDGVAASANNYSLPTATSTVKGGVEIASDTVQSVAANAVTATAGRTYGVQLNSAGQAVVNVPWSDTNTTYGVATTSANGLMSAADKTNLDKAITSITVDGVAL